LDIILDSHIVFTLCIHRSIFLLNEAAIEREKVTIESDESWLVSTTYTPGYNKEDFDDSTWKNAGIVPSSYNQFVDLDLNPDAMWLPRKPVIPDTSQMSPFDTTFGMADSLGAGPLDTLALVATDTLAEDGVTIAGTAITDESLADSISSDTVQVYLRKKINLEGTPVDGYIYMTADNEFSFFLNEEYITDDEANNFAVLDTIDFGYISYSIKSGLNTFSIRVIDTDHSGGGIKLYGYFELIPLDILAAMEERSRVAALDIDPGVLYKINTLNKNRVPISQ